MPEFTAIGTALGATVAASAGAGIGAFGVGVAATAAAAGIGTYMSSQQRQAKKAARTQQNIMQEQTRANEARLAEAQKKIETSAAELKTARTRSVQQAQAQVRQRRRAIARNRTIFTSPLGIAGTAETTKKQLLGQ